LIALLAVLGATVPSLRREPPPGATPPLAALLRARLAGGVLCAPVRPREPEAQAEETEGAGPRSAPTIPARPASHTSSTTYPAGPAFAERALALPPELRKFYEARSWTPAWVTEAGPSGAALELARALAEADEEGLRPADYHAFEIGSLLQRLASSSREPGVVRAEQLIDLETLLSDAFLLCARDLLGARSAPVRTGGRPPVARPDPASLLAEAAASGRPAAALRKVEPAQPAYRELKAALGRYRAIRAAGGWPDLSCSRTLRKGACGTEVAALRDRLTATGDLTGLRLRGAGVFDEELKRGLERFQRRHGLPPGGALDEATRAALAVELDERIEQMELNLGRLRALPRELGERYVAVNVPAFELQAVENGEVVLRMRAVVGRRDRPTPSFSDSIAYIVVNPTWNVPETIASEDIIPLLKRDPSFLERNRMYVFDGWGPNPRRIDPNRINWSRVDPKRSGLRFVQAPGRGNYLGRMKFMFPNEHQVYLHDTPQRHLFERRTRAFSSGCIWVDRPLDLAEFLLSGASGWSRERIERTMKRGSERTIFLASPVPVYILYLTAFVDEHGLVNFRKDIYGRDRPAGGAIARSRSPVYKLGTG